MRRIDEHNMEVLITLALVTASYGLALRLHISGPIAVVVAGLFIGNHGARFGMSENTRRHVFQFWDLADEIFNSLLFLLIGLEVLVVGIYLDHLALSLAAIPLVLAARWISVAGTDRPVVATGAVLPRRDHAADLGRFARRYLGGAGPVAARDRVSNR